jgi:hypothetical protein
VTDNPVSQHGPLTFAGRTVMQAIKEIAKELPDNARISNAD